MRNINHQERTFFYTVSKEQVDKVIHPSRVTTLIQAVIGWLPGTANWKASLSTPYYVREYLSLLSVSYRMNRREYSENQLDGIGKMIQKDIEEQQNCKDDDAIRNKYLLQILRGILILQLNTSCFCTIKKDSVNNEYFNYNKTENIKTNSNIDRTLLKIIAQLRKELLTGKASQNVLLHFKENISGNDTLQQNIEFLENTYGQTELLYLLKLLEIKKRNVLEENTNTLNQELLDLSDAFNTFLTEHCTPLQAGTLFSELKKLHPKKVSKIDQIIHLLSYTEIINKPLTIIYSILGIVMIIGKSIIDNMYTLSTPNTKKPVLEQLHSTLFSTEKQSITLKKIDTGITYTAYGTSILACLLYFTSATRSALLLIKESRERKEQDDIINQLMEYAYSQAINQSCMNSQHRMAFFLMKNISEEIKYLHMLKNKKYTASMFGRAVLNGAFEFTNAVQNDMGQLLMKISATTFAPMAIFESQGAAEVFSLNTSNIQYIQLLQSFILPLCYNTPNEDINFEEYITAYIEAHSPTSDDMQLIIKYIEKIETPDGLSEIKEQLLNAVQNCLNQLSNRNNAQLNLYDIAKDHAANVMKNPKTKYCSLLSTATAIATFSWLPSIIEVVKQDTDNFVNALNMSMSSYSTALRNSIVGSFLKIIAAWSSKCAVEKSSGLDDKSRPYFNFSILRHALSFIPLTLGQLASPIARHASPVTDTIITAICDQLSAQKGSLYSIFSIEFIKTYTKKIMGEKGISYEYAARQANNDLIELCKKLSNEKLLEASNKQPEERIPLVAL